MEQKHSKVSSKFFFLSLGVIISLITSVVAFLNLAFEILNKKFPDVLNSTYQYGYMSYSFEGARVALATLIIIFPVFILVSYFWKKETHIELGTIDLVIKKWMLSLLIFLAGIVIVVDLVTLVRYFVSGEITDRFMYKVLITILVALFVGVHYMFELQGREKIWKFNIAIWATIKSSVLVLLLIIWAFMVIGSPKEQRTWRLDDRRTQDLQSMQWQVISYWQQKEELPETIAELSNPISGYFTPVDPEFERGVMYEYRAVSENSFELCATFSAPMPKGWQENSYGGGVMPMREDVAVSSYPYPGGGMNESWDHEAGRTCFLRTIDEDLYPPFSVSEKAVY